MSPAIGHLISPGMILLLASSALAKTFWRVLIFNGGDGVTGASEVRFKNNGNSQSGNSLGSGGTHGNAFDDSTSTNWTVTGEFGEFVGLEFSGEVEITEVEIVSLFNDNGNTLLDYEVQFSDDGIIWTTVWSSFGNPTPTSNGQGTESTKPLAIEGASIVHQRAFAVLGGSPNAMVNSKKVYSIHGCAPEAMVNSIKVYAIYDTGS